MSPQPTLVPTTSSPTVTPVPTYIDCPATCFGETCEYWDNSDGQDPDVCDYEGNNLETVYGCNCNRCSCIPGDPSPTPTITNVTESPTSPMPTLLPTTTPVPSTAFTQYVGTASELNRALALAHDNSIIEVVNNMTVPASKGVLSLNKVTNVLLHSTPGEHFTIFGTGQDSWNRFLTVGRLTEITIANLTIDGFTATSSGGAFLVGDSDFPSTCFLTLDGVEVRNCGAEYGAVAYIKAGSNVTFKNSKFYDNVAHGTGRAGVAYVHSSFFKSVDSEYTNNFAFMNGGCFYTRYTDVVFRGDKFVNNHALNGAGVIKVLGEQKLEIYDSLFDGNYAYDHSITYADSPATKGGAIAFDSGMRVFITRTTMVNNYAHFLGGAIASGSDGGSLEVTDSRMDNNHIDDSFGAGGCIFFSADKLKVTNTTFTRGSAVSDGGGVHIESADEMAEIHDSSFEGCSALSGAGVKVDSKSYLQMSGTTFHRNKGLLGAGVSFSRASNGKIWRGDMSECNATRAGGAIKVADGGSLVLDNMTFTNNVAQDGGAIAATLRSWLTLNNAILVGNKALRHGGGAFVSTSFVRVRDTAISDGEAGEMGGGAYLEGTETFANFVDSTFDRCKAFVGGAIAGERVSSITANNTGFHFCEAANQGGAVKASGSGVELNNCHVADCSVEYVSETTCLTLTMCGAFGNGWYGSYIYVFKAAVFDDSMGTGVDDDDDEPYDYKFTLNEGFSTTEQVCVNTNVGNSEYVLKLTKAGGEMPSWSLEGYDYGQVLSKDAEGAYNDTTWRYDFSSSSSFGSSRNTPGGGGLHLSNGAKAKVRATEFDRTRAINGVGGAFTLISGAFASFDQCKFAESIADFYGPIAYINLGSAHVQDSYSEVNTTAGATASFFNSGGDLACISGCAAGQHGDCVEMGDCYSCKIETCTDCNPGKFAPESGGQYEANTCQFCLSGEYAPLAKSIECSICTAGSYATDDPSDADGVGVTTGATSCVTCPAGKFTAGDSATSCVSCQPGEYASAGSTACTLCEIGTFTKTTGSATCKECASGTYAEDEGATSCPDCAAGKAAQAKGASTCVVCAAGSYSVRGASSCIDCRAGEYATDDASDSDGVGVSSGASTCVACAAGTYSSTAASLCISCDAGKSTLGQSSASSCTSCSAGTASKGGAASCTVCNVGEFSNSSASACTACPNPRTTTDRGASSCNACGMGFYMASSPQGRSVAGSWGSRGGKERDHCSSDQNGACCLCPEGTEWQVQYFGGHSSPNITFN